MFAERSDLFKISDYGIVAANAARLSEIGVIYNLTSARSLTLPMLVYMFEDQLICILVSLRVWVI